MTDDMSLDDFADSIKSLSRLYNQDVNAQHMAAMGLTDVKLGGTYPDTTTSKWNTLDRCPSRHPEQSVRCVLKVGHTNVNHVRGLLRWAQDDTADLARSTTLSLAQQAQRAGLIDLVRQEFTKRYDGHIVDAADLPSLATLAVDTMLPWMGH